METKCPRIIDHNTPPFKHIASDSKKPIVHFGCPYSDILTRMKNFIVNKFV